LTSLAWGLRRGLSRSKNTGRMPKFSPQYLQRNDTGCTSLNWDKVCGMSHKYNLFATPRPIANVILDFFRSIAAMITIEALAEISLRMLPCCRAKLSPRGTGMALHRKTLVSQISNQRCFVKFPICRVSGLNLMRSLEQLIGKLHDFLGSPRRKHQN